MVKGDIHMSMGYSGDILSLRQHNKNIVYVVPEEGTALWVDFMVVSKASTNKDIAYKFLNFINEPTHAAQQAKYTNYATPNLAAKKLIPQKVLSDELIYPPESVLIKSETYRRLPPRVTRFENEIFSRVTQ
jgi:spermidine/putrescine transport system substrate-binding protein